MLKYNNLQIKVFYNKNTNTFASHCICTVSVTDGRILMWPTVYINSTKYIEIKINEKIQDIAIIFSQDRNIGILSLSNINVKIISLDFLFIQ